ncbi:hypothetical protein FKD06_25500, partial [Serratia sp. SRS-8-S-2018]|uniref:Ig-like domain-containing protein n=1 Tax=Serratia sp. SRS-8-S-2018 TaxID=2591107 RepID=UPI00116A9A82
VKADETPSETISTFATSPKSIEADGTAAATLTFTAKDAKGNAIKDLAGITFVVKDGSGQTPTSGITVTATTNVGDGTYTAQLSGTLAGIYTVTPQNNGSPVGSLSDTVELKTGAQPDPDKSTTTTDKTDVTANGIDNLTITFVAKDANNNPMPGIASDITFKVVDKQGNPAPTGAVTVSPATEISPPGTYTATLTAIRADEYSVIPQYDGSVAGPKVDITVKADETP